MRLTQCPWIEAPVCRLYPFGDLHFGSEDCDEDLLDQDLDQVRRDPSARAVFNGDLLQMDLKNSKGDVYAQKYPPREQKRILRAKLEPIAHKILVMLGGNHDEGRTQEDSSPVEDMAEWLGVPYCRDQALLKVPVGKKPNGKPAVYTIYQTHGWAGGRVVGSKATNLHRLRDIVLADVYIISHTHQQLAFPGLYYIPDLYNGNVREVVQYFINTGSYQKRGRYPAQKGMPGVVLGTPVVQLSGRSKKVVVEI